MSVVPSNLVSSSTQAGEDDLWAVSQFFFANWAGRVEVTTSWRTDVVGSEGAIEARMGMRNRPYRNLKFDLAGIHSNDVRQLRAMIARNASARCLTPIYCDQSRITTAAAAGAEAVACDTRYRRLYQGQRVLLVRYNPRGSPVGFIKYFEVRGIVSLTSSSVALDAPLLADYGTDSRVYPLIEGRPQLRGQLGVVTDNKVTLGAEVDESVGTMSLPAALPANGLVISMPLVAEMNLPVLDLPMSWESMGLGVTRAARVADSGITDVLEMKGPRPMTTSTLSFKQMTRERAWKLKEFFDSRRGRLFPFFLPAPTSDMQILAGSGGATWRVPAVTPLVDWQYFPWLAAYNRTNGHVAVSRITGVVRDGSVDVVTCDPAIPFPVADCRRLTAAMMCRFDTESMTEQWVTDKHMLTQLPFFEVLDVTGGMDVPPTGDPYEIPPGGPYEYDGYDGVPDEPIGYLRLTRCDGVVTSLYVPGSSTFYLWDPVTEYTYTADGTTLTLRPPATGTVLRGWQEIPFEPGNPLNPAWVPACGDPVELTDCPGQTDCNVIHVNTGRYVTAGNDDHWEAQEEEGAWGPAKLTARQDLWVASGPATTEPAGSKEWRWISTSANTLSLSENRFVIRRYRTTIVVGDGCDPSTLQVKGSYAVDNKLLGVKLNGTDTGISGEGFGTFKAFTLTGLTIGDNVVTFETQQKPSDTDNPHGLVVKWTDPPTLPPGSPTPTPTPTPPPSTSSRLLSWDNEALASGTVGSVFTLWPDSSGNGYSGGGHPSGVQLNTYAPLLMETDADLVEDVPTRFVRFEKARKTHIWTPIVAELSLALQPYTIIMVVRELKATPFPTCWSLNYESTPVPATYMHLFTDNGADPDRSYLAHRNTARPDLGFDAAKFAVVSIVDAADGTTRVYKNGTLVHTYLGGTDINASAGGGTRLLIGTHGNVFTNDFSWQGDLADFRMWDTALSDPDRAHEEGLLTTRYPKILAP